MGGSVFDDCVFYGAYKFDVAVCDLGKDAVASKELSPCPHDAISNEDEDGTNDTILCPRYCCVIGKEEHVGPIR